MFVRPPMRGTETQWQSPNELMTVDDIAASTTLDFEAGILRFLDPTPLYEWSWIGVTQWLITTTAQRRSLRAHFEPVRDREPSFDYLWTPFQRLSTLVLQLIFALDVVATHARHETLLHTAYWTRQKLHAGRDDTI
jgi:hypothetical protein